MQPPDSTQSPELHPSALLLPNYVLPTWVMTLKAHRLDSVLEKTKKVKFLLNITGLLW